MARESIGEDLAPLTDAELPLQSVYRWEAKQPDAIYMTQPLGGGRLDEYSWRRTLDEARRMAAYLQSKGYAQGTRVGLVSKNCAHHFIFELGAWMAGCTTVSVYPTVDADTLGYILEHAEIPILLVGKLDVWPGMAAGVPDSVEMITCELSPEVPGATAWQDVIRDTAPIDGNPVRDREDISMIVYTSGSTGRPKGVLHTFASACNTAHAVQSFIGLSPNDRMLSYLPLAHVLERSIIVVASMMHGCQVYFAESLDTFVDDLKRARPTVFASVPRLWLKFKSGVEAKLGASRLNFLLKLPIVRGVIRKRVLEGLGLDSVRIAGTGSAPLPREVHEWYRALGVEFLDSFGMSEVMGVASLGRPGKAKPGTLGPSIPGSKIRISDIGEIELSGPGLMKGYYKQPEITAETFTEDGWLRTGDQGNIDEDGLLRITGRVKEIFKTAKGKYVAPAPIEGLFNATELIEQCCVMGVGEPKPYVVVMLNDLARENYANGARDDMLRQLGTVFEQVNGQLQKHERLSKMVVTGDSWEIADGLLTPTMKIKRSAIEKRYDARAKALGDGVVAL